MSRGLGKLQREIMDTLDEVKVWMATEAFTHNGKRYFSRQYRGHIGGWNNPHKIIAGGNRIFLSDGIYDTSASLMFLAKRAGKTERTEGNNDTALLDYQRSFYRAIKTLIARGFLQYADIVLVWSDGQWDWASVGNLKQRRLIKKVKRHVCKHDT